MLKVFATLDDVSFRWLELPELDQPPTRVAALRGAPGDPLEQMLAAFMDEMPRTRQLNPAAYPSQGWTAGQVRITTRRGSAGSA